MYNPMPHRITPEDTSMKMMDFGGGKPDHNLFGDYISLLNPENTADIHSFAIQNLDSIIDSAINAILQSKSSYLGLLNVIELDLPPQLQDKQKHIMQAISYNLNMERAIDGLQKGIVMRLVKGFKRKKPSFHKYFIDLINAHLK